MRVGVLGLQGGVAEHERMLTGLGAETVRVRAAADLAGLDALVLPGGESSVLGDLLDRFAMRAPVHAAVAGGLPTLGTCAGLVLLATDLQDPAPGQRPLALLDLTVRRNARGAQVHSDVATVAAPVLPGGELHAAFIRAPGIVRVGPGVEVIATRDGEPVGVRAGSVLGFAGHPELTGDTGLHALLLGLGRSTR